MIAAARWAPVRTGDCSHAPPPLVGSERIGARPGPPGLVLVAKELTEIARLMIRDCAAPRMPGDASIVGLARWARRGLPLWVCAYAVETSSVALVPAVPPSWSAFEYRIPVITCGFWMART